MTSSRWAVAAATGTVAATVACVATLVAVQRRWAAAHDPTDGAPLCLPEGDDLTVETRDGAELAARVAGSPDGPLVVLAHGWSQDRRIWGAVGKRLVARGHRVVLYDQRGHGASTIGDEGLTMAALGADVADVLAAVDARDAVLAGHSMGGMAAQAFALEHPDVLRQRVAALAIVSSACDGMSKVNRVTGAFTGHAVSDRALALSIVAPLLVRKSVGRRPHLDHLRAVRDLFVATPPPVRRQLRRAINGMDFSERLRTISVPVFILAGRRDKITPFDRSARIAELIDADLRVFDDHGHMLPWEAPDDLAEVLADLGQRNPTGAAFR